MDEPVPVRRAAVGCALIALAGIAVALLVRLAIFSLAPPRDDAAVVVATRPRRWREARSDATSSSRVRGAGPGERDAGDGRVQVA